MQLAKPVTGLVACSLPLHMHAITETKEGTATHFYISTIPFLASATCGSRTRISVGSCRVRSEPKHIGLLPVIYVHTDGSGM